MRVWLSGFCMIKNKSCASGFKTLRNWKRALGNAGFIFFAGPVGSGKTTLMHELAKSLFKGRQVMSIEDPVEIKQEEMLQLQLNEAIGLSYENFNKTFPTTSSRSFDHWGNSR